MSTLYLPVLLLLLLSCVSDVFCQRRQPDKQNVAGQASPNQGIFGSTQYPIEQHHSLRPPIDKSQVYWSFGGSSVLTKYLLRLTPTTQDRRGWIWNEYPLENTAFEIEIRLEVQSKPHFGGDGLAIWIIKPPSDDPAFAQNVDAFNGGVFGMHNNFNGVGVLIDVYDNDARRNNPAVFAISNDGSARTWNHDNDFSDDMLKNTVDPSTLGLDTRFSSNYASHRCVADIRNTGKTSKIMIRYLHKNLHVYVDTNDGQGYKYCFAVKIDRDLREHHIAITAATGQVADQMDIHEVTVRYLKEEDRDIDDSLFKQLGSGSTGVTSWHSIYWFVVNAWNIGLLSIAGYMVMTLRTLSQQRIDAVYIAQQLNTYVLPHYATHAALTLFLLVTKQWTGFLLNAPMLCWRAYEILRKKYKITPAMLVASKGHVTPVMMNTFTQLSLAIAYYSMLQLYYLYKWIA